MIAVAIDGPAGAGKSTIAKKIAKELGFVYIDTGALYRTIAYDMVKRRISPSEDAAVKDALSSLQIELAFQDGEQHVYLDGEDVSSFIRTPEISMAASSFSALPPVRAFLLELQRDMARRHNVIMDGRDIGTVVLPNADIKIFLTASPEDRAKRRHQELLEKGMESDYASVLEDIKKRDDNDANRPIAPLRPSQDSLIVDTTGNTLEKSVSLLSRMIKERLR